MNVLITGATSGIGRQLALDYHRDGQMVTALGRNHEALAELAAMGLHTGQVDLADREGSLAWFAAQTGPVDLAILNAGTCEYIDMPHFDAALVTRVMTANVIGFAISVEGVLPLLRRSPSPHLVGVGSSAAYLPLPRAEAYGASKAAVAYMVDTLRITLKREGIAVSLVAPGFVQTPLTDQNDFPMPMRISVAEASRAIRRGIARRDREIHFPKRFTLLLKALTLLPKSWWAKIAQRMITP